MLLYSFSTFPFSRHTMNDGAVLLNLGLPVVEEKKVTHAVSRFALTLIYLTRPERAE